MIIFPFIDYVKDNIQAVNLLKRMKFNVLPLREKDTNELLGYRFIHVGNNAVYTSDVDINLAGIEIKNQSDIHAEYMKFDTGRYIYVSDWEIRNDITVGTMESLKELEIAQSVIRALNVELEYTEVQSVAKLCYGKGGDSIVECWSESDYNNHIVKENGGKYTLCRLIETMRAYKELEEEEMGNMRNWY